MPLCCRWDSALCPKRLNYHDFISWKLWKNLDFRNNEKQRKTHLDSIIRRVMVVHMSLTQFIWKKSIQNCWSSTLHSFFLILTDCGNVVSKVPSLCHSWTQA